MIVLLKHKRLHETTGTSTDDISKERIINKIKIKKVKTPVCD